MLTYRSIVVFAALLPACHDEPSGPDSDPRITSISIDPGFATVAPGERKKFSATATFDHGESGPVQVQWTATGGTISHEGDFTAGHETTAALVVADCLCGAADTAEVTIESQAQTGNAQISISVVGLPDGSEPVLQITGPGGFDTTVTSSGTLLGLHPGNYTILAATVAQYRPLSQVTEISLAAYGKEAITLEYRLYGEGGLPPHPRVWMTPARIEHLKTQAGAGTPRWNRVKAISDAQLARGSSFIASDLNAVPSLCLTYLATGDQRYARRAGTILTYYAVEENDLTGDSGYYIRFNLPVVTMGLDWCYEGLNLSERRQVATWLMNRADWTWPESNPPRLNRTGTNCAWCNYFWGFMMTGPAALAATEDDTGHGGLSGSNRPAFHTMLVQARWLNEAVPTLNSVLEGGAWPEGTNYESTWRLASFVDAFNTAGYSISSPFLAASLRWRLHSTMPGGKYKVPFGDQPRVSAAPTFTYDRMAALYAMGADPTAPSELVSQVYLWLDLIGQAATSEVGATSVLADELLRFDPARSGQSAPGTIPHDYLASGPGFFIYRTDWNDPAATALAFQSGPVLGHGAMAQNSMMIWKGDFWVSANANIYSHSGTQWTTWAHNSMTVGDIGQPRYHGNFGEIVGKPQVGDALVAVRGQARNAYGYPGNVQGGRTLVDDYLRTVSFLPLEDIFIVIDRATVFDRQLAKTWRWHTRNLPEVSGRKFVLESEKKDFRCFGEVLAPADVQLGTESFTIGLTPGNTSSHAVAVSVAGRATDLVITVLQCSGSSNAPPSAVLLATGEETRIQVRGRVVSIPLSEDEPVRLN